MSCQSTEHPPRYHDSNWKLDERYFSFSRGREKMRETVLEELMRKTSTDQNSSLAAIAQPETPKNKNKRSATDLHKQALSKFNHWSSRLSRAMSNYESSLPSLRRSLSPQKFAKLKEGLSACRAMRDGVLDEVEDMKSLPAEEDQQHMMVNYIQDLVKKLQEHNHALVEAFDGSKGEEKSVVKMDQENPTDQDGGA